MNIKTKLLVLSLLGLASVAVQAGTPPNSSIVVSHSIPAVGQPGLIALAVIVGLLGAHLIRKYKAPKI